MVKVGCAGAREDEIEGPANPPSHCTLISSGGTACQAEGLPKTNGLEPAMWQRFQLGLCRPGGKLALLIVWTAATWSKTRKSAASRAGRAEGICRSALRCEGERNASCRAALGHRAGARAASGQRRAASGEQRAANCPYTPPPLLSLLPSLSSLLSPKSAKSAWFSAPDTKFQVQPQGISSRLAESLRNLEAVGLDCAFVLAQVAKSAKSAWFSAPDTSR